MSPTVRYTIYWAEVNRAEKFGSVQTSQNEQRPGGNFSNLNLGRAVWGYPKALGFRILLSCYLLMSRMLESF